jgi:predicted hotdog family 3-hydroxylacyl-ACP dehydratase
MTGLTFPLDHAAIAARVPHAGTMCLLSTCQRCSADEIVCTSRGHADPGHPLRSSSGLLAVNGIEIASQAMALHGTLAAPPGTPPRPGFLASVRGVVLHVPRLDTVPGALRVQATKLAGDERQASYQFALHDDEGRALVEGRATVILSAVP